MRTGHAVGTVDPPLMTQTCGRGSFRLGAKEFDRTRPLLGFLGDKISKFGGRARKHLRAQVGKPCLHLGIGEDLSRIWPIRRDR
jgi:hypothetical protein